MTDALAELVSHLQRNPDDHRARAALCRLLLQAGEHELAMECEEGLQVMAVDDGDAALAFGQLLKELGRADEAEGVLRHASRLSPQGGAIDLSARILAAEIAIDRGDREEAEAILPAPSSGRFVSLEDLILHGWLLARLGKPEATLGLIQPALKTREGGPELARLHAWANMDAGHLGRAGRVLRAALKSWPESAPLHHACGVLAMRRKRLREAARFLSRALDLDPSHQAARRELGLALSEKKRQTSTRRPGFRIVATLFLRFAEQAQDPKSASAKVMTFLKKHPRLRAGLALHLGGEAAPIESGLRYGSLTTLSPRERKLFALLERPRSQR